MVKESGESKRLEEQYQDDPKGVKKDKPVATQLTLPSPMNRFPQCLLIGNDVLEKTKKVRRQTRCSEHIWRRTFMSSLQI
jgi:hypothetical protein